MTSLELLQAMGHIDPELILLSSPEVPYKKRGNKPWVKWLSLAACLCLVIGVCMVSLTSMTQDLVEDGLDTIYLFGGVSINMSNVIFSFFIAPVFSLLCSLMLWTIGSGSIILPIWLFRDLCIPLIHFCILSRLIQKNRIQKKSAVIGAVLLMFATVIADSVLMDFILLKGRLALFHTVFRLVWTALCGLLVLGQTVILRFYRNNRSSRIAFSIGATLALCANAFLTYGIGPGLACKFAIDGIEILLMPMAMIILSAYSYLLGQVLTKRFMLLKLSAWFIGIASSEFVALWLLGVPHTPPTADRFMTLLWLVLSVIPFVFCLLGMLKAHRRLKRTSA